MWKLLQSKKVALWLIVLLTLEIGLLNSKAAQELINLEYLFYITTALFWLNCLVCTMAQFQKAWRNFKALDNKLLGKEYVKGTVKPEYLNTALEEIKKVLESTTYRIKVVETTKQTSLLAYRNPWGIWAMVVFHVALLWIIIGGVWGGLNKLEGNFFITEGYSQTEQHQNYTVLKEGPFFREKHTGFELKVNQVELKYQGKLAPKLDKVLFSISKDGQEVIRDYLKLNKLFNYEGFKISLGRRGFTPILEVVQDGLPHYSLLSLDIEQNLQGGEVYRQKVFLKDLQKEMDFLFFPSPPDKNKRNSDYHVNNPQLQLTYLDDQGQKQTRTLGLNDPLVINGAKISMVDAKPWVEINLDKTPGIYFVYFGFLGALIGLVIYYGLPYQKITIVITKEGDLQAFAFTKLTSANFTKQIETVIKEISKMTSIEYNNQLRRDEEIW